MIILDFATPGILAIIAIFLIIHFIVSSILIVILAKNLKQEWYYRGNIFINLAVTLIVYVILAFII